MTCLSKKLSLALGLLALTLPCAEAAFADPAKKATEAAILASGEVPEEELLDVVIHIFDPGVAGVDPQELAKQGTYEDLREAESMYFAVRLMETLQSTGQWGAVRVVPRGSVQADVQVQGTILESTGKDLKLAIVARDSSGKAWLERRYEQEADARAYSDEETDFRPNPFQNLYNRVANDLLRSRQKLKPARLQALPAISELRFAEDLAPETFAGYLGQDRKGRLKVQRLPPEDFPMMDRILEIREREELLVDILTDHYSDFYSRMLTSYGSWRDLSYEEQLALQKLRRKARKLKILGVLSIIGGVWAAAEGEGGGGVTDLAVLGGIAAMQAGIGKSQEAQIHREALKELAASLDAELDPLVVEVEGQTLRLTGSAETQYAEWRKLLKEIFVTETGAPVDPNEPTEVTASSRVEEAAQP